MAKASRHEVNLSQPPAGARRVQHARGEIAYWEVAPRIYVTVVTGHMTTAMSQLIIEQADKLYARGGIVYGFHDWLGMSGYDSRCRVDLTNWVLGHRAHSALHIGVVSRLVAMGVTVANLALGGLIHIHDSKRELESALDELLKTERG